MDPKAAEQLAPGPGWLTDKGAWETWIAPMAFGPEDGESLSTFEGNDKPSLAEMGVMFLKIEEAVSPIQTLQVRYNHSIVLDVRGWSKTEISRN